MEKERHSRWSIKSKTTNVYGPIAPKLPIESRTVLFHCSIPGAGTDTSSNREHSNSDNGELLQVDFSALVMAPVGMLSLSSKTAQPILKI